MDGTASDTVERTALGLGLVSMGLGLAELLVPRQVNRLVGLDGRSAAPHVTRALGVRELSSGLGLLGRRRPAPWLWARVAGDVMDLALLIFAGRRGRKASVRRAAVAGAAVLGVTALDLYAAVKATGTERRRFTGRIRKSMTIATPPEKVYQFWRDLRNLPRFMARVESVEPLDSGRSRWRARGPGGKTVEWDAEIVEDRPNEKIQWRALEGAQVTHRGEVVFRPAPGDRGTEILLSMEYVPPAGALGRAVSFLSDEALEVQIGRDLQQLKQIMELGQVVRSDAGRER